MHPDPASRPRIEHVVGHPVVQRARGGKEALAPEEPRWLVNVLSGGGGVGFGLVGPGVGADGDVVMGEA